jgi:hypothetical protein
LKGIQKIGHSKNPKLVGCLTPKSRLLGANSKRGNVNGEGTVSMVNSNSQKWPIKKKQICKNDSGGSVRLAVFKCDSGGSVQLAVFKCVLSPSLCSPWRVFVAHLLLCFKTNAT